MNDTNILINISEITIGEIIKRPSSLCKTPYVADISLDSGVKILGHTPSLGCCGLAEKDSKVIMSKLEKKKNQTCSHRVELACISIDHHKLFVGINPKLAETIAENSIKKNFIKDLINVKKYHREVAIPTHNSRFDFAGIDSNNKQFVMEIKNVPLADFVDVLKKDRKNYTEEIKNKKWNEKISYFPDGYRKKTTDAVSPRALKHVQELEKIAITNNVRAILCFVIQRTDVSHFQTSNIDKIYKDAVYKAWQNGVEIKTIQVEWNQQGECRFVRNNLPISLKEGEFI